MAEIPTLLSGMHGAAPPAPPAARPSSGRPSLGRAVMHGKLRFLSVSQIVQYDPRQGGGCPRRWAFAKIFGKKEPETERKTDGVEYAKQLERYLKTGEDALSPVLQAGKHLLPRPGSDLEVEQPLGDIEQAVKFRERLLRGVRGLEREALVREMRRVAGLLVADIPIDGCPDVRHRRGEYVAEDGELRREDPGMSVVEVGDHKTTSRIRDHVSRGGKLYRGWAKTTEQILEHPQMLGYGVHAADKYPDATHLRLSHHYFQTKGAYSAEKRTGLISVEEVRRRWRGVESIAREMEDVAASARRPEDVPHNLAACDFSFKGCPHRDYCDRPARTVAQFFGIDRPEGTKMGNGLFDAVGGISGSNGSAQAGLFGQAPPPPAPPVSEADYRAAVEASKQRLLTEQVPPPPAPPAPHPLEGLEGFKVGQPCNGRGYYANAYGTFVVVEPGHTCARCAEPVARHEVSSVNPADAVKYDPVAAADPLAPEQIAQIADPEVRARAEAHAREHQARAAQAQAEAAAAGGKKEKTGGRCPAGGRRVQLSNEQAAKKKYTCPECGKVLGIKPSSDYSEATLPGHLLPKSDAAQTSQETLPGIQASQLPGAPATSLPPPPAPAPAAVAAPPPPAPPPPPTVTAAAQVSPGLPPAPPPLTAQVEAPPPLQGARTISIDCTIAVDFSQGAPQCSVVVRGVR